jgi:hypothetical protein
LDVISDFGEDRIEKSMTANISLEIGTSTIFSAAIFALGAIPGASWEVEFC